MKNIAGLCLFILSLIGTFCCGSIANQGVFSITECESQGGNVVLSSPQQPAACISGQQTIGTIETPNFSGICCKSSVTREN